ncbi:MAG TPA: helix-turn-helix domain-containing protein [Thermoanaerobaculia bacterium]|jgi:transcriptional regulator with XRE-family HTH domain
MTEPAGIEEFYGAAILQLRWRVYRWGQRKLAKKVGVSAASISNYERGKVVPSPAVRAKLAAAFKVSLAGLDRLAAAIQSGMIGLLPEGEDGVETMALEVAADLGDDFRRESLSLILRFLSSEGAEPQAGPEDVNALAPVLFRIDGPGLRDLAAAEPGLKSWAFVKLVGEESVRAAADDAKRARELADVALWLAEQVEGEDGPRSRIFAWAWAGNVRRVGSDHEGAEQAFARSAQLRQEEEPGDRPELPDLWHLFDLEASLRIDLRQYSEALRLLGQAAREAPPSGAIQARLLSQIAHLHELMDDSKGAITVLRQATALIELDAEPHLLWMLQFNLMRSLAQADRAAEAEALLPELRLLQKQVGNGLNQLRLRWLEGTIHAGLGRIDPAIEAISEVRAAFAKDGIRYDEALASLELAGLYLEQGRTADVKKLVVEMAPVFQAKGVHEEAKKALALFRRAVERETVTVELVRRVVVYLRRAQGDPKLRFEEAT